MRVVLHTTFRAKFCSQLDLIHAVGLHTFTGIEERDLLHNYYEYSSAPMLIFTHLNQVAPDLY